MAAELVGPRLSFRYDLIDIREIDGQSLLESAQVGDNVIAILTRLRDRRSAVHEIVQKVSELEEDARLFYLRALFVIAGLRGLEGAVEEEARKVPMYIDILENEVLGREFKKGLQQGRQEGVQEGVQQGVQQGRQEGELALLRRMIEARFGALPKWVEERLADRSAAEIEELGVRLLKAESLEEWLK
jgi:predicted transposase YdaD